MFAEDKTCKTNFVNSFSFVLESNSFRERKVKLSKSLLVEKLKILTIIKGYLFSQIKFSRNSIPLTLIPIEEKVVLI